MPAAIKYYDNPNIRESRDLEEAYNRELRVRCELYQCNWKYYYGEHKKHLVPDQSNTEDNVIINLVELLLDKGVSSLMGTTDQGTIRGPDFEVVKAQNAPPNVAQRVGRAAMRVMG